MFRFDDGHAKGDGPDRENAKAVLKQPQSRRWRESGRVRFAGNAGNESVPLASESGGPAVVKSTSTYAKSAMADKMAGSGPPRSKTLARGADGAGEVPRPADLEVGDTADLEICATGKSAATGSGGAAGLPRRASKIRYRRYQERLIDKHGPGVVVLHWARQVGKSFTLAAWAVNRLVEYPGRLVTVLSNSRDNGAEFVRKCAEICRLREQEFEFEDSAIGDSFESVASTDGHTPRANHLHEPFTSKCHSHPSPHPLPVEGRGRIERKSLGIAVEDFRMEVRITKKGQTGRIKVLAANPRTARGFSGDLILDEFAFHEDSAAIWEAAEPILASNPDFKCRIASTGNGKHNMFYRMACGFGPSDGTLFQNPNGFMVSRLTRTAVYEQGVKIYDLKSDRKAITPDEARQQAMDKRAYDQNYECVFSDENMTLLTYELIAAAQSDVVKIDSQEWSNESIQRMRAANGALEVGNDIGRNRDLSMVTVIERDGSLRKVIAMLKMENMRLPDQQRQLAMVCRMRMFYSYCGDMTGLGLGLVEYLQEEFGQHRIQGVNFSSTEPVSGRMKIEGRKAETARVTEIMAVNLLTCFEERTIQDLPNDPALADDLRKPEKVTSPGGRVSIAATRDEAGHADGFWSLALAVRAGERNAGPVGIYVFKAPPYRSRGLIG